MLVNYGGKIIPYVDTSSFYERRGKFGFCSRGSKLGSIPSRVVMNLVVGSIKGVKGLRKQAIFVVVDINEGRESVDIG